MSVHYLLPSVVIEYLREHGLYREEPPNTKGKEKADPAAPAAGAASTT